MAIYKYPLKMPMEESGEENAPTKSIDYVMFRREEIRYNDSMTSYTGEAFGSTAPPRAPLPTHTSSRVVHNDIVYLAMPPSLGTNYSPSYRQVNLGAGGQGLMNAWSGRENIDDLAATVQTAANAAAPEFTSSIMSQVANNISGLLGIQGNIDTNSIQALTGGRVFNPYAEQIFNNINFRQHTFSFKLLAKSRRESEEIFRILKYFKVGALPKFKGGDYKSALTNNVERTNPHTINQETGALEDPKDKTNLQPLKNEFDKLSDTLKLTMGMERRFFTLPDKFQIKFRRYNPASEGSGMAVDVSGRNQPFGRPLHFRIKPSVCNGIQVNYTPDNQYTAFKDYDGGMIHVPAIVLNLSFLETALVTKEDAEIGY